MANAVTTVQFHGQDIITTTIDGVHHVAVNHICALLGVAWNGQFERIKRHPVLSEAMRVTRMVAKDGKERELVAIPLNKLNGWLFGIQAARVKPELRDRLIAYQRECFDVLAAHFMPKASTVLLPSQKRDLQNKIAEIAYKAPEHQRSQKFADIYRKLKNEFHVATYSEISQDQYDHAFALVESFDVITKIEAPKLKIDNHTYGASQVCISHLRNQVYGNPAAMETIEHLEKCLVASYSRVEEAKFRLSVANTMLSSWING